MSKFIRIFKFQENMDPMFNHPLLWQYNIYTVMKQNPKFVVQTLAVQFTCELFFLFLFLIKNIQVLNQMVVLVQKGKGKRKQIMCKPTWQDIFSFLKKRRSKLYKHSETSLAFNWKFHFGIKGKKKLWIYQKIKKKILKAKVVRTYFSSNGF